MTYAPPTKRDRLIVIIFSAILISLFLYLALRDNGLADNDLLPIVATLRETPKYDEFKIKATTYHEITLITKEYNRVFKITGMTYKATNHNAFKSSIIAGDIIELKVKTVDFDNLDKNTFSNNYNDVYSVTKNGISYINNSLRTELANKDGKWAYFFVAVGLIMLPYGFIKKRPLISMTTALVTTAIVEIVIMLILRRQ